MLYNWSRVGTNKCKWNAWDLAVCTLTILHGFLNTFSTGLKNVSKMEKSKKRRKVFILALHV